MKFAPQSIPGSFLISPDRIEDERGYFARSFCRREFQAMGLNPDVAQGNVSFNRKKGTLRGMHYQLPRPEAKLVRCARGALWDVILDLRPESPAYKSHFGARLDADNGVMLYVPEGCAHGFLTLEDDTEIAYQMSEFYGGAEASHGVRWNDPAFNISWPAPVLSLSDRDRDYPDFRP